MSQALRGDTKLIDKLIPDFPFGCRRITPSVAYLNALHEDNMHIVTDGIANVFEDGFKTESGETILVDAIVCATGFDLSFRPRFPIIGRTGNLQDIWTARLPSSYMSCAIPGMPNYFSESYVLRCCTKALLLIRSQHFWVPMLQLDTVVC